MVTIRSRPDGSKFPITPKVQRKPRVQHSPQQLLSLYNKSSNPQEKAKLKKAAQSMANKTQSDEWKTIVSKMKTTQPYNLETLVQNHSSLYAKKLGVQQPFEIKYNNSMSRLARVKATRQPHATEFTTILEVNPKQYKMCYEADPILTQKFLDYAMAHELAHLKQYESYGFNDAKAMPKYLMEKKADEEAFRVSGITEKEVDSIVKEISTKLQKPRN